MYGLDARDQGALAVPCRADNTSSVGLVPTNLTRR